MRNKIFGGIGVLWGGGVVIAHLLSGSSFATSSGYEVGRHIALVFGMVMFGVGIYYLCKKN